MKENKQYFIDGILIRFDGEFPVGYAMFSEWLLAKYAITEEEIREAFAEGEEDEDAYYIQIEEFEDEFIRWAEKNNVEPFTC